MKQNISKTNANNNRITNNHRQRSLRNEILYIIQYSWEFIRGFISFSGIHSCVTVFGSARFSSDHPYYKLGVETGKLLAENNLTVMTGAGPGIMEAANRGAKENNGKSIGCAIKLPNEQNSNIYLDHCFTCKQLFIRKLILTRYSIAFIALPGGYGTLDEIFELMTLIKTGRTDGFPVILIGKQFWNPMLEMLTKTFLGDETISQSEIDHIHIVDSPEIAIDIIQEEIKSLTTY